MEILAIVKLAMYALSLVEVVKRFIPDKQRTYANPIIAVVTGLVGAYYVGGQHEVLSVLMTGALAGAGAIGAYKIPKEIASKFEIN